MSDFINETESNIQESTTTRDESYYRGPEVVKKKRKKPLIVLGIAGAVIVAGAVTVLAMGPAKAMNSVRMLGSQTSYYKWVEQKNSDGVLDFLYSDDLLETAYDISIQAAYASSLSDLADTVPAELSAVVLKTEDAAIVQLPQISDSYIKADSTGIQNESLSGCRYFLPNADNGVKSYLKKYVKRFFSDAVDSATLTKNEEFEINGIAVTANKVTATYNLDTVYDKLDDIFEDMKVDEDLYNTLSDAGIKKSEFKTIFTTLSDWASTQALSVDDDKKLVMNCYVDNTGVIIGREFVIEDENGNSSISYLVDQADSSTKVHILIGQDQYLYLVLSAKAGDKVSDIPTEDAVTVQEYVQNLSAMYQNILTGVIESAGLPGLEEFLGLTESEPVTGESGIPTVIELGQYTQISIDAPDTTVTDSDVAQELQDFVNYYSDMIEITDRKDVQNYDYVNIDYVGRIDGETFDGGSDTDSELQVGSGTFLDEFEEALIGHETGSTFTFEVTFPDPYTPNEDLSGKLAEFQVTINAIGKRELSDEFVAANTEYSTVNEYRDIVYNQLVEEKEYDAKEQSKSDIMTAIIQDCTIISLNADDVAAEHDSMIDTYESYAQMYGVDLETYALYMFGLTLEDFYSEIDYYAEFYVEEAAIIQKIAEQEGLTLTEEEYQKELASTVEQYNYESTDALEESYGKEELQKIFLQDKVYEFLLNNAIYITE